MQLYLTFSYIKLKTSKNAKNTKKRYFWPFFGIFACFWVIFDENWWFLIKWCWKASITLSSRKCKKHQKTAKIVIFWLFQKMFKNRIRKWPLLPSKFSTFSCFSRNGQKQRFSSFLTTFWWYIGDLWGWKSRIFRFFQNFQKPSMVKNWSELNRFCQKWPPGIAKRNRTVKVYARAYIYTVTPAEGGETSLREWFFGVFHLGFGDSPLPDPHIALRPCQEWGQIWPISHA